MGGEKFVKEIFTNKVRCDMLSTGDGQDKGLVAYF